MNACSCEFKGQMAAEMRRLGEGDPQGVSRWVSLLFQEEPPPCCLLTFLFYYAYCKECDAPLSGEARRVLKPLLEA